MKPRHKLVLLIVSIFIIPGLVTIGWFWGAGKLENLVKSRIADISTRGQTITCNNLEIRGFPFRIGLNCDNTSFDDTNRRVGLTAGELRTTAQIYNPGHVISELDGPLIATNKNSVIEANWHSMRASSVLDISNLSRASIETSSINLTTQLSDFPELQNIAAENLQMHIRQNENNIDIAASGINIVLETLLTDSPLKIEDVNLFATVHDNTDWLKYGRRQSRDLLRGSDVTLHDFTIKGKENVTFTATGPIEISARGIISGEVAVTLTNIGNLRKTISEFSPELAANFSNITNILTALSPTNNSGEIKISMTIRNGQVQAGIIPLGRIPAI